MTFALDWALNNKYVSIHPFGDMHSFETYVKVKLLYYSVPWYQTFRMTTRTLCYPFVREGHIIIMSRRYRKLGYSFETYVKVKLLYCSVPWYQTFRMTTRTLCYPFVREGHIIIMSRRYRKLGYTVM